MPARDRLSLGIDQLDEYLGGGLLPGTLTVVAGATGIGKTQLGLHFAGAGAKREGRRGIIFDMTTRGDSQSHAEYARSLFGWDLHTLSAAKHHSTEGIWSADEAADYLHIFDHSGRRVTRGDLDFDDWKSWKTELAQKLGVCIHFFYSAFVHGTQRAVIDGIEPVERPGDSIQFELFEYVYHQILRKDCDWVARDLFREQFRANQSRVEQNRYDPRRIGCLLLYTTREVMLEDLLSRPLEQGDVLSVANTVILMGKVREGNRFGRALYVAKHRGSHCHDEIVPFEIGDDGIAVV